MNYKNFTITLLTACCLFSACTRDEHTLWTIGKNDNSSTEFALAPNGYKAFLSNDFGYEDRYFLVGFSDEKTTFPYILPGVQDIWGGTGGMAGIRTNDINILFGINETPVNGVYKLIIRLTDAAEKYPPTLKVFLNQSEIYHAEVKGKGNEQTLETMPLPNSNSEIEIAIDFKLLKKGGNEITLTIWDGSWIMFDNIEFVAPDNISLTIPESVFVRDISAADYELAQNGKQYQPLLVDIEHLTGEPELQVMLDGKKIFEAKPDTGRFVYEVLMPAVKRQKTSKYKVLVAGRVCAEGKVTRSAQATQTLADYVNTKIGTAHSRWMIAPGPWMPFSMVKLSPDNQNGGWQSGYQPTIESIGTFSHIHEWTMSGLGMFPTNGELITRLGDEKDSQPSYRSKIDKASEEAPIGYYKVKLTDYDILAELTATTRCGFQRYTYPQNKDSARIMIDLKTPAEYGYNLADYKIEQVSEYRLEGYSHQVTGNVWWEDSSQEYTVHFVIEFDQPIKEMGGWDNSEIRKGKSFSGKNSDAAGVYVMFDVAENPVVQTRSGISLVSIENAALNLKTEITDPFAWSFDAIRNNQKAVWNDIFNRIQIKSDDYSEKMRFYTNMYRAVCSRNTWSDVNGEWKTAAGNIHKFENSEDAALGCDAFWNSFWNLNQLWNLVLPEWSNKWVNSQLAMYETCGWLAKGPAGMKYIPVMVAEHEIPLIVGAYQMGIRNFDTEKAFEAVKKMQTTPVQRVYGGLAGNKDLVHYLKYKYVPCDLGRFSNTLEYSYDDWTVAQFAKALGKEKDYNTFIDRGYWWKNAIEPKGGYAHMRKSDGTFIEDFDPFKSGSNEQYVEGNAWQLSYFVPQDVSALAEKIGKEKFSERLDWGFEQSEAVRYNAPNDKYWDYPVVQGNQQSMHFAFLFNWAEKPWLTQKWSRSIIDRYYGKGIGNAYLGDEDQGQMSAWLIMASLGLFQMDGGCRVNPIYEIASPLYEKVIIHLGRLYGRGESFTIEAKNTSRKNKYVQNATLNGHPLNNFWFPASELLKGGELILEMGSTPNMQWGVGELPQQ